MSKLSKKKTNTATVETLFASQTEEVRMKLTDTKEGLDYLMSLLTDLYSNPIEAAVREIMSNAIDATVYNKDKREVHVTIPNVISPTLQIKDNGVGMSTEEIKEKFSVYGLSDKIDDMNLIGAFGLGAKAPLQYTSSFTITTVKDGVETVAIVSRREQGHFIEIVSVQETDKHSGTIVSIPAKADDTSKFMNAVDRYRLVPTGVDLYIDDEFVNKDPLFLYIDKIALTKGDDPVYGKLYVNKSEFKQKNLPDTLQVNQKYRNNTSISIEGWSYGKLGSFASVIVDVVPGVVNFSTSREEIVSDERLEELIAVLNEQWNSERITEAIERRVGEDLFSARNHLGNRTNVCDKSESCEIIDNVGCMRYGVDYTSRKIATRIKANVGYLENFIETETDVFGMHLSDGTFAYDLRLSYALFEFKGGLVKEINEINQENFENNTCYSMSELGYALFKDKDRKVIVLKGIKTLDELKWLQARRTKLTSNSWSYNREIILFTKGNAEWLDNPVFSAIKENATVYTAAEARELINEKSKNTSKPSFNLNKTFYVSEITYDKLYQSPARQITEDELLEIDLPIVVVANNYNSETALITMSNATGTPIEELKLIRLYGTHMKGSPSIPAVTTDKLKEHNKLVYEVAHKQIVNTKSYEQLIDGKSYKPSSQPTVMSEVVLSAYLELVLNSRQYSIKRLKLEEADNLLEHMTKSRRIGAPVNAYEALETIKKFSPELAETIANLRLAVELTDTLKNYARLNATYAKELQDKIISDINEMSKLILAKLRELKA